MPNACKVHVYCCKDGMYGFGGMTNIAFETWQIAIVFISLLSARRLTQLAMKRGVSLEWARSASSDNEADEPAGRPMGAGDSGGESDDADERLSISSDDEPVAGVRGMALSPELPLSADTGSGGLGRAASQVRFQAQTIRHPASPRR